MYNYKYYSFSCIDDANNRISNFYSNELKLSGFRLYRFWDTIKYNKCGHSYIIYAFKGYDILNVNGNSAEVKLTEKYVRVEIEVFMHNSNLKITMNLNK